MADDTDVHDIEALRITQQEAREVINHQIQTFSDVDNKAAKTFRLEGLLMGLIVTAVSIAIRVQAIDHGTFINIYTKSGILSLITSFILAIAVYTTTKIETGIGPNDIQRLVDRKYSEKEWLILLIRSEARWMDKNETAQTVNGAMLSISHFFLILSVLLIGVGVGKGRISLRVIAPFAIALTVVLLASSSTVRQTLTAHLRS